MTSVSEHNFQKRRMEKISILGTVTISRLVGLEKILKKLSQDHRSNEQNLNLLHLWSLTIRDHCHETTELGNNSFVSESLKLDTAAHFQMTVLLLYYSSVRQIKYGDNRTGGDMIIILHSVKTFRTLSESISRTLEVVIPPSLTTTTTFLNKKLRDY